MSAKSTIKLWMSLLLLSCSAGLQSNTQVSDIANDELLQEELPELKKQAIPAAELLDAYFDLIKNKRINVLANQTSMVNGVHLVDTLLSMGVDINLVYAAEHGFRGNQANGAYISDERDEKTGLLINSLYGKNKKPSAASLEGVDAVVFDVQDIGVRFYTFISSLQYVMEACADQGVEVIVLDRPNPWGNTIDGPVLEKGYESFVGMHPIPLIYGMTIGEYALMINGEKWMTGGKEAKLTVIPSKDYGHQDEYMLPIAPSPNLPTQASIYMYPSLALFEGTVVSVGRGTDFPFEMAGHPDYSIGTYEFTPEPNQGSTHPPLKGKKCLGQFYSKEKAESVYHSKQINLSILQDFYQVISPKTKFFLETGFFDKLAGNGTLRKQIEAGLSEEEIRASWQVDIENFKKIRRKYLLYQD